MSANKPIDVDENGEPRWKYVCKKCLGDKVKSKQCHNLLHSNLDLQREIKL